MSHYKQENGYGCGLYSVANALQDDRILSATRLGLSKNGNNIGQINKWFVELEYDFWLSVLKYDNDNPIEIFDLKPDFEVDKNVLWIPFFIVIKSTKEKNHMLGCRYMRNGTIIVHDSLRDHETTFECFDALKEYYSGRILSYECLRDYDNQVISIIIQ